MIGKLPARPRIKETYVQRVVDGEILFLISERRFSVFEGKLFTALAPLLDGHHAIPELLGKVGASFPLQEFFAAIGRLAREGVLADGPPAAMGAAYFDELGAPRGLSAASSVRLDGLAGADVAPLAKALAANGISTSPDAELRVVVTGDYLTPELEQLNAEQLESGRPWLITKTSGVVFWVGPLIRPRATACWRCLEQRLRANREVQRYAERWAKPVERAQARSAPLASAVRAGASLAALEVAKALAADSKQTVENRIFTFDLVSGELTGHTVVQRPQCRACGTIRVLEQRPLELASRPKVNAALSGHRSVLPDETFAKYEHHISPITGVVTSLIPRDDESGLVHNHTAGHYFPLFEESAEHVQINRYARGGAGGRTVAHAKTSTLCESLERYSGIFWGEEHRVRASYRSLGEQAVHMQVLAQFSDDQYARRAETNPRALSNQQIVSDPLDDDAEISWTPAWSLTHQRVRYLPTSYCFYGFREPGFQCLADSNGCAAGNNLEEAILHGLLELLERDAVAMWWYNRVQRPAVDGPSFGLAYWDRTERYYREVLGRSLHVLDLRVDTGIPVLAVVSRREDHPIEDITVGFSAHLDPALALEKALGGTNQYLPSLQKRAADGSTLYRYINKETLAFWKTATYASEPYLLPDPAAPVRRKGDLPSLATSDLKSDLDRCVESVRALGLEVLVVDQSRPDLGINVARVVVPGLRHFWRRLARGRLYDVPVSLGWLAKPRAEGELNPIACFV